MRDKKESVEDVIEILKKEIEAEQGEILEVENLGTKDFARTPDRNLASGVFVQVNFRSPSYRPNALQERVRLNHAINRVLVQRVG